MGRDLFTICYEGELGENLIRTLRIEGKLHISLEDVIRTLSAENRRIENTTTARMTTLLMAVVKTLDSDEFQHVKVEGGDRLEVFLAEPGLYRVLAQDSSKAGKKFQRWLFHDVVPTIREFGEYPAPQRKTGSELSILANRLQESVQLMVMEIEKREALERRVDEVEYRVIAIESNRPSTDFCSIVERVNELGLENIDLEEAWHWCEHLRSKKGGGKLDSTSGHRIDAKYPISLVDEALATYQEVAEARKKY
ncbi:BRO family protein [Yersinia enterocolitica]|nr:hypothetical protein [Yersinia enterocolitica]EKN5099321.1 hypothetical protein [Yersinia enterocolitica]